MNLYISLPDFLKKSDTETKHPVKKRAGTLSGASRQSSRPARLNHEKALTGIWICPGSDHTGGNGPAGFCTGCDRDTIAVYHMVCQASAEEYFSIESMGHIPVASPGFLLKKCEEAIDTFAYNG